MHIFRPFQPFLALPMCVYVCVCVCILTLVKGLILLNGIKKTIYSRILKNLGYGKEPNLTDPENNQPKAILGTSIRNL